jgi:hypothetical protein
MLVIQLRSRNLMKAMIAKLVATGTSFVVRFNEIERWITFTWESIESARECEPFEISDESYFEYKVIQFWVLLMCIASRLQRKRWSYTIESQKLNQSTKLLKLCSLAHFSYWSDKKARD